MTRLLVIGGTGFIGYHIIKEAKKRKWKITSISLSKPGNGRYHEKVEYKIADISNYRSLEKKIKGNFEFVINAGGYGKHPDFGKSGKKLFNTHYMGLVNLIRILSTRKIKKSIQIGSSAEYGNAKAPQNETSICSPKTPYALAKLSCTNLLLNFHKLNNFPSTILRFFLVYGPKQHKNRILPQIIENCLKNKKFPVTKGQQYCDFCYIDDAIQGIFKTLKSKKTDGEILNIGFGKPIKIKNVINIIRKVIKKGVPQFGALKYNSGINMKLFPDIRKAKKMIGWRPKTNFIKGLNFTINSYK